MCVVESRARPVGIQKYLLRNPTIQLPIGFIQSAQSIQPVRTIIIDIRGDEAQILGRMKQKTRYNINLALKKGIVVRPQY